MDNTQTTDSILQVENLVTTFQSGGKIIRAVDNCSFNVTKGKTLGIVGESGSGKSVTSLSIMRLVPDPPGKITSGKIIFEGANLLDLSERQMRSLRGNKMAMIFQEPMTSLNPVYTIGNQISEVFILHKQATAKQARELSIEMLKQVRIPSPEKRIDEYPHQLSGGMRQRVMIAMSLACKPNLLIADEPTTALDVTIQSQILALMNELQEQNNMAIILITHDFGVVAQTCDDVAVMYAGRIVEKATVHDIFKDPKHPYTKSLLNAIPRLGEKKKHLNTIQGHVPSLGDLPQGCRFQNRCPVASGECRVADPPLETKENGRQVACYKA